MLHWTGITGFGFSDIWLPRDTSNGKLYNKLLTTPFIRAPLAMLHVILILCEGRISIKLVEPVVAVKSTLLNPNKLPTLFAGVRSTY